MNNKENVGLQFTTRRKVLKTNPGQLLVSNFTKGKASG